jgi:AhpD family alkylhydroperoxidase
MGVEEMTMQTYPKRRFESVGEIAGELSFLLGNWRSFVRMASGQGQVSPAFRERIMLAVTAVNDCRYCTFVHSLVALKEGFTRQEIASMLQGALEKAPQDEHQALLYAQHWADTRGHPEPEARQKLVETYGESRAKAIEVAIRAIMFGNYFGNSLDATLYAVSKGKLARPEAS